MNKLHQKTFLKTMCFFYVVDLTKHKITKYINRIFIYIFTIINIYNFKILKTIFNLQLTVTRYTQQVFHYLTCQAGSIPNGYGSCR